ncbi:CPBP family intramembrane glutamic endopeptidase [Pontimicrobium aquaticum]|uniref:CPBP family intramembrane metalloprotease n=1 Tax=Pontimicrobium aquaticum TaxID=2565367 RepID=A0A4U0F1D0_9FLAO|nr:type II CAAX endopeptidase family protein [Pontimicrobium aquaticum]TJY38070.1 CPBP family intramembrane metalloprotease [Pontimicrobium aquaticum]
MKSINSSESKEIYFFSIIAIALSSIICFISYAIGDTNISILSVLTPTILALIYTLFTKGKKGVHQLFIKQTVKKISFKWILVSLLGIPLIASLAMLSLYSFDISKFALRTTQLMPQIIVIIVIALGEEYGWRGFLLPRLMNKFNPFYSNVILGLIWGIWHFPAYLIGTGVPLNMNFMVFLIWVILASLFIGWVYYYTKSVLTSILIHISANAAFNYLLILPEFTGSMNAFWFFILYLFVIIFAIFYNKRKDLFKKE